jgi:hypothetical protein
MSYRPPKSHFEVDLVSAGACLVAVVLLAALSGNGHPEAGLGAMAAILLAVGVRSARRHEHARRSAVKRVLEHAPQLTREQRGEKLEDLRYRFGGGHRSRWLRRVRMELEAYPGGVELPALPTPRQTMGGRLPLPLQVLGILPLIASAPVLVLRFGLGLESRWLVLSFMVAGLLAGVESSERALERGRTSKASWRWGVASAMVVWAWYGVALADVMFA